MREAIQAKSRERKVAGLSAMFTAHDSRRSTPGQLAVGTVGGQVNEISRILVLVLGAK